MCVFFLYVEQVVNCNSEQTFSLSKQDSLNTFVLQSDIFIVPLVGIINSMEIWERHTPFSELINWNFNCNTFSDIFVHIFLPQKDNFKDCMPRVTHSVTICLCFSVHFAGSSQEISPSIIVNRDEKGKHCEKWLSAEICARLLWRRKIMRKTDSTKKVERGRGVRKKQKKIKHGKLWIFFWYLVLFSSSFAIAYKPNRTKMQEKKNKRIMKVKIQNKFARNIFGSKHQRHERHATHFIAIYVGIENVERCHCNCGMENCDKNPFISIIVRTKIGPTFQIKRIQPFVKIKWENEYT